MPPATRRSLPRPSSQRRSSRARTKSGSRGKRIDFGIAERQRFEARHELSVQSRRCLHGVPVVGREHERVQLACRCKLAELLVCASRPVAPARLVAQDVRHGRDDSRDLAPVAGPQCRTRVPLAGRSLKSSACTMRKNSRARGCRLHDSARATDSANGLAARASRPRACTSAGYASAAASASARE